MKTSERAKYSNIQQRRGTEATNKKANGSATEKAVFEIAFWSKLVFEHLYLASSYHICNSHQQAENLSPKEAVSLALDKRKGGVGRFS